MLPNLFERNIIFDQDEGSGGSQPSPDGQNPGSSPQQPPAQPQVPSENWEERFKGQQRYAQSLKTQHDSLVVKHSEAVTQYEGKITTITAERDTALTAKQALENEKTQIVQERDGLKRQLEVIQKITADPALHALLPLQAKGLLATGNLEGEQLDTYLKDYAATIGQLRTEAVTNALSGATPPSPSGAHSAAGMTEDQLYTTIMNMSPADPRYQELMRQFSEMGKK